MKASELIGVLQRKIELDGDLEVLLPAVLFPPPENEKKRGYEIIGNPPSCPIVCVDTFSDPQTGAPMEFVILDEAWFEVLR